MVRGRVATASLLLVALFVPAAGAQQAEPAAQPPMAATPKRETRMIAPARHENPIPVVIVRTKQHGSIRWRPDALRSTIMC